MAYQNMTKALGIIRNVKNHIHGIPYIATFTIMKNSVVDFSYYMLLGRPWLKDAKVTHDWGNNVITIQGNGIVRTILINRKLGAETRRPQASVCNDLMEGLTYEEEDLIFEIERELISNGTITIYETVSLLNVGVSEIRNVEEFDLKQGTNDQRVAKVVPLTVKLEDFYVTPKVSLEDKVYLETYYHHSQDDIQMNKTLVKIQVQNL